MQNKLQPIAKAEMLTRKPVAEVFEAFVNPDLTSKFWFTKGSGRLEAGKQVRWDWEMYDFSLEVDVTVVEKNSRIVIEWPAYGASTTVEWAFTPRSDGTTFISVTNKGFPGDEDQGGSTRPRFNGRIRLPSRRGQGAARTRRHIESRARSFS